MKLLAKSIVVAVLAFVAYELFYNVGIFLLNIRDGPGTPIASVGISLDALLREAVVSGVATYVVLAAATSFFTTIHQRTVVLSFLLILATVSTALVIFNAEYLIPQQRIGEFRASVLCSVSAFAAAVIVAMIHLRRESQPESNTAT